jgi:hypothetical protein
MEPAPGFFNIRSNVYDIDVVAEIMSVLEHRYEQQLQEDQVTQAVSGTASSQPSSRVTSRPQIWVADATLNQRDRPVSVEALQALLPSQREKLMITSSVALVQLQRGRQTSAQSMDDQEQGTTRDVANLLDAAGRARFPLRRSLPFWPAAGAAVLLAFWVWAVTTVKMEPALLALSLGMVLGLTVGAAAYGRALVPKHSYYILGARFREASLADRRSQMARAWANVLVASIAGPLGALAILVIQAAFGLGPFA